MVRTVSTTRARKRPRTISRTSRIPRGLKYNGIGHITRTINLSVNYSNAGFDIGGQSAVAMNLVWNPVEMIIANSGVNQRSIIIPNAAEYIALYDMLMIDKVELTWSSGYQAGANNTVVGPPKFLVCNDYNDALGSSPTLTEIQQQSPSSFYAVDGSSHKWSVKPKFQRVIYQTPTISSYEPSRGFVNSNSTIPHFGTRMAISNAGSVGVSGAVDCVETRM
jgi:hypothetical protein